MTIDEKQFQTLTIRETHEKFVVDVMEYPFQQAGVLYLKFIAYGDGAHTPTRFLTVQPQDILYRVHGYTREEEDELITASDAAREMQVEYMHRMEAEMKAKAAAEAPPEIGDDLTSFG